MLPYSYTNHWSYKIKLPEIDDYLRTECIINDEFRGNGKSVLDQCDTLSRVDHPEIAAKRYECANEKISIEDVVNDEFLFYSYMEGMLPTAYIIIAGENPCSNLDEWLHKRQDGVLLKNDPDGIGLDISADEELMKQIDTLGIQMWSAGSVFTWKDT